MLTTPVSECEKNEGAARCSKRLTLSEVKEPLEKMSLREIKKIIKIVDR